MAITAVSSRSQTQETYTSTQLRNKRNHESGGQDRREVSGPEGCEGGALEVPAVLFSEGSAGCVCSLSEDVRSCSIMICVHFCICMLCLSRKIFTLKTVKLPSLF